MPEQSRRPSTCSARHSACQPIRLPRARRTCFDHVQVPSHPTLQVECQESRQPLPAPHAASTLQRRPKSSTSAWSACSSLRCAGKPDEDPRHEQSLMWGKSLPNAHRKEEPCVAFTQLMSRTNRDACNTKGTQGPKWLRTRAHTHTIENTTHTHTQHTKHKHGVRSTCTCRMRPLRHTWLIPRVRSKMLHCSMCVPKQLSSRHPVRPKFDRHQAIVDQTWPFLGKG